MQRKVILAALLLCTASAWAYKQNKKSSPIKQALVAGDNGTDYHKIGSPMPPMRVVDTNGRAVATNASVQNGANLFVMMFNPTCEHCEEMTVSLEKGIGLFKQSNIVLMAAATMGPYLPYFNNTTHYMEFTSLKVGLDSDKFIDKTFNYEMLPQINIYDKERKLIKSFSGLETIDSLKPYIQ
jgi:hypothetical protein